MQNPLTKRIVTRSKLMEELGDDFDELAWKIAKFAMKEGVMDDPGIVDTIIVGASQKLIVSYWLTLNKLVEDKIKDGKQT